MAKRPTAAIPEGPGTYVLVLSCARACRVPIGRLGLLHLQPGWYLYVGSAFGGGGLRARIGHHQRIALRPHWHVDYLRRRARLDTVWYSAGARCEHAWAARIGALHGATIPLPGFGSSDCNCMAHLFRFEDRPSAAAMRRALHSPKVLPSSSAIARRTSAGTRTGLPVE